MKEFTTIKINQQVDFNPDDLLSKEFIHFDFSTSTNLISKYIGRPISMEDSILKLSTQMYYEGIPLSEMNTGSQVIIFKDRRKNECWTTGEVADKFYIKAKKQDWKIEEEVSTFNGDGIDLELNLNQREKYALELGETPLSMDDKWFIYCENNTCHFIRSWTGIEMFKGQIVLGDSISEEWKIKNIIASRSWDSSIDEKKKLVHELLEYGIKRKLKLLG